MTGLHHGWGRDPDTHADFIHGGVPVEDFDEPVRWKKKSKKVTPKKKPGCPGNDGGAHIYVWTTELNMEDLFFRYFGFHKTEKKVCAGCGKKPYATRLTEQYTTKFKTYHRWTSPEQDDEGYREYRRDYRERHGWTDIYYGNW